MHCGDPPGYAADAANNTYHCLRTLILNTTSENVTDSLYCRFKDDENFVEYFDMKADPWQLENVVGNLMAEDKSLLESKLRALK